MSNMLRKALLGGAALAVMTTGAAADELATLKAQLAALQSQVDSTPVCSLLRHLPAHLSCAMSVVSVATPGVLTLLKTAPMSMTAVALPLL